MSAKKNSTNEKEEKKGKVKVGKLKATKELSAEDAKKVKGGVLTAADKLKFIEFKIKEVLISGV